ncbi:response regulator transcription factor [Dactylosporangium vinaceum]|uniref:LuxR C-terminal-related transcriptional regulator n=1 Tax=Dactylosporangium vinaceum TaxID=53362 RepID=A0ABV5M2S8_9ACTN|nr:response regulator transcription factor [Dactylosporangium vinaceum]UAB99880.1 response regulator transcription factor [Dactylosporangium vinaceum]
MIDVLIVDGNPIVRAAIRTYLAAAADIRVVGEAPEGRTAVTAVQRLRPAVTLLDHRMPIADGLSIVGELVGHTSVLVLTSDSGEALIAAMLRGGARGYLVHGEFDPPELPRAVRAVAAGKAWLSPVVAAVTISTMREQAARDEAELGRADRLRETREQFGVTQREREVLDLLCAGHSNAAIARRLLLTEKTVKNHLHHIFTKLGAGNRTEAAMRWSGRR